MNMASFGMPKEELDTPALVVDVPVMEANMRKMAEYMSGTGAKLRPHFKTHKCPLISHKQLELGAIGITCAKLDEAQTLVD